VGSLSAAHWALIILAFIVLFGYKRLPDASRSIGRSLRIFKAETKGLRDGEHSADHKDAAKEQTPAVPAPAVTPPTVTAPTAAPLQPLRDDEPSPLPERERA